jgi:chitinase
MFNMKTKAFHSIKGYLAIAAIALLFASCKKAVVPNEETTALSTKKSMANSQTLSAGGNLRKVGYLTLHAVGGTDYDTYIDDFVTGQYTDIIIAFINPDASGNFAITPNITQAITKGHAKNVKMYFGITTDLPNGNENTLINNNRAGFISNIRKFITNNNFDGVDLDFEGGGLTANFSPFVVQLSDSLQSMGKKISVAIASYQRNAISDPAYGRIDFLNVMSYDNNNRNNPEPHSSFNSFVTDFNNFKIKMGGNASKINMGIPTYAWEYENGVATIQIGFNNVIQEVPYSYCLNAVSPTATRKLFYDGHPAIRQKIPFVLQQGIGGIMIWHVLADTKDDATSIIKFINYCEANASGFYPGTYRLNNTNSGKTLQIAVSSSADGAAIVQGVGDSMGSNLWRFNYVSGVNYGIINNYSNKAMDVSGASTANNAPLEQWPWWDQAQNQQFKLQPDALGYYTITAVHSNKPIQILNASSEDSAQVVQADADGSYNQKWMIWR